MTLEQIKGATKMVKAFEKEEDPLAKEIRLMEEQRKQRKE